MNKAEEKAIELYNNYFTTLPLSVGKEIVTKTVLEEKEDDLKIHKKDCDHEDVVIFNEVAVHFWKQVIEHIKKLQS